MELAIGDMKKRQQEPQEILRVYGIIIRLSSIDESGRTRGMDEEKSNRNHRLIS